MLGKILDVKVKGSACDEKIGSCDQLYCGFVDDKLNRYYKNKVYIISKQPPGERFCGAIVAVANKGKGSEERMVLAKPEYILYSPDIRTRLSRVRNQPRFRLKCLYEKSCGCIVFYEHMDEKYFLVVKNKNGKSWGFPKGHIEIGETEEQTALREVKEETNLEVEILKGFKETSLYSPYSNIKKKVVIFLAKTLNPTVKVQEIEIDKYLWLKSKDVLEILRYENDKKIFFRAIKWLKKQS